MEMIGRGIRAVALAGLVLVAGGMNARAAEDLNSALRRLDAAAVKFKSAEAEIVWDNVQTEPLPDKDTQTGNAVFERKGGQLSVALHIKTENGRPYVKEVAYTGGALSFYEPQQKRMSVYQAGQNRAAFETLLTLGFGASGRELEKAWAVSMGGAETLNGVAVTRLELIPKDEQVRKNVSKAILWLDLDRGVALRQRFLSPDGNYREVTYKNLKLNVMVPGDAFQIHPASGTQVQNH
jgi:outer membrane lipoprotein-sorting protein